MEFSFIVKNFIISFSYIIWSMEYDFFIRKLWGLLEGLFKIKLIFNEFFALWFEKKIFLHLEDR